MVRLDEMFGLKRWSLALILFVIFMVFIAPVIVGIGSILIAGRTMYSRVNTEVFLAGF